MPFTGDTTGIKKYQRKSWTYHGGEVHEEGYHGQAASILALFNAYKSVAGHMPDLDSLSWNYDRGRALLVTRKSEDGEPTYELWANDLYKPIEQHPTIRDALSADEIVEVRDAIDKGLSEAQTEFADNQLALWRMLARGNTEYLTTAYVLREISVVSHRSGVAASFTGVNTVQDPPDASAVVSMIGSLPEGEWLKKAPAVRQRGLKWEITQEYWWADKWSLVLYGGTLVP